MFSVTVSFSSNLCLLRFYGSTQLAVFPYDDSILNKTVHDVMVGRFVIAAEIEINRLFKPMGMGVDDQGNIRQGDTQSRNPSFGFIKPRSIAGIDENRRFGTIDKMISV